MKDLIIEWKHLDKEGNTCKRCSDTEVSLLKAIKELKEKYKTKGIRISYKETKLDESEIQKSNSVLLNGIPIEDLLDNTKSVDTPCNSCCELIGSSVSCRALDCQGQITEDIPVDLIKSAVKNLLGKEVV